MIDALYAGATIELLRVSINILFGALQKDYFLDFC
jgi:hypothetical protein